MFKAIFVRLIATVHSDHILINSCWQDVLEEWLTCQRSWLYLEPIFSSDDINRQLPVEGKRYQTMERTWRKVMKAAHDNSQVILGSAALSIWVELFAEYACMFSLFMFKCV